MCDLVALLSRPCRAGLRSGCLGGWAGVRHIGVDGGGGQGSAGKQATEEGMQVVELGHLRCSIGLLVAF